MPVNFNRLSRRAQSRVILKLIPQLREVQARLRANPSLPHCVRDPISGEVIDALDGESERLFDQMELVALHVLGLPVPKGRA
jgi:hypothetical protein